MSTEQNKATTRRLVEELNKGNLSVIDELVGADYVGHGAGGTIQGPEEFKESRRTISSAFPDWHSTIEDITAEGETVVVRLTLSGTHKGTFSGVAATGKQFRVSCAIINRFAAGKIVESWNFADAMGIYQQLGIAPPTGRTTG